MKMTAMTGMPDRKFALTLSALDCTGCGSCVNVCPGKKGQKALTMESLDSQLGEQDKFAYGFSLPEDEAVVDKFKVMFRSRW